MGAVGSALRVLCWMPLAAFAGVCGGLAAQDTLTLHVEAGFDGNVYTGRCNPVFLHLTPRPAAGTPAVVTVTLLRCKRYSYDPSEARVPVASSEFEVRFPPPGAALSVPVLLRRDALRMRVEVVTGDGGKAAATIVVPQEYDWPTLVLTRRRAKLAFLTDAVRSVVFAAPEELPDDWRSYESVACIVLDDVDLADLPPGVAEALRKAMVWGTGLVVTGPGLVKNAGSLLLGPLADVRIQSTAPPERLAGLEAWFLQTESGAGELRPLATLQLAHPPGTALVRTAGRPVLLRARVLCSCAVACGFDPAELAWEDPEASYRARAACWRQILHLAGAYSRRGRHLEINEVVASLVPGRAQMRGMLVPIVVLLAIFALVLGPVNFVLLRRARRGEWMLLIVPAAVVVCMLAAAVIFRAALLKQDLLCAQTVVQARAGRNEAVELSYFGVLPRGEGAQTLSLAPRGNVRPPEEEMFSWGRPRPGSLQARPVVTTEARDRPTTLANIWQRPRAMRFFACGWATRVPAPAAEAHLDGGYLAGRFTNTFDHPLKHVTVAAGWRSAGLGTLLPGETKSFRLRLGTPRRYKHPDGSPIGLLSADAWLHVAPAPFRQPQDTQRRLLLEEHFERTDLAFAEPLIAAWGGPQSRVAAAGARRNDARLLIVSVPVTPLSDEHVELPPGAVPRSRDWVPYVLPCDALRDKTAREGIGNLFRLPIAPGALADCALTLHAYVGAPRWMEKTPGVQLSLLNWQQRRWEPIGDPVVGEAQRRIENASRFVKQPEGWVAVLEGEPGEESAWRADEDGVGLYYLDVAFEGRRP